MSNHETGVERQRQRIRELQAPTEEARARRKALLAWFRARRPLEQNCCPPWGVDPRVRDELAPVDLIDWKDDGEVLPVVAGEFFVKVEEEEQKYEGQQQQKQENLEKQRQPEEQGDKLGRLRRMLSRSGWRQHPPEEGSKLVRFIATDRGRADLKAALQAANDLDLTAAPNHFIPLNYDAKGQVGPMATRCELVDHSDLESTGVRVVIIDTGLATEPDRDRTDGWLLLAMAAESSDIDELDLVGKNGDIGPDGYLDLAAGHGTSVAGVAECVVPGIEAVAIRALGPDGFGVEGNIADAIRRAELELGEDGGVINMSFGSQSYNDEAMVVLADAIEHVLENERICLVAAAGNWGDDQKSWPAAFEGVVAVAGLTADGTPAEWSSRGAWVNFSAQGEGIIAPYVVGRERPGTDPGEPHRGDADTFVGPNPNALWLGTSFAAPQISALLARYLHENPGKTAKDAVSALRNGFDSRFEWEDLSEEGYGIAIKGLLGDCGCDHAEDETPVKGSSSQ